MSTYEYDEGGSKFGVFLVVGVVVASLVGGGVFIMKSGGGTQAKKNHVVEETGDEGGNELDEVEGGVVEMGESGLNEDDLAKGLEESLSELELPGVGDLGLEDAGPLGVADSNEINEADHEIRVEDGDSGSVKVAKGFLNAVMNGRFDEARGLVDRTAVTDAKIAGLFIVFEEGRYGLRGQKPVRVMFDRERVAGVVAYVVPEGGGKALDLGLNLRKVGTHWKVNEVSLDSLLGAYAERVGGGDVHFTPLVKNPQGGDTLILYFGFDEDGLTRRTEKQLDVVAGLLKLDSGKKLTVSGHTDALGSDQYNEGLSGRRARAVASYLLRVGVPRSQIVTKAEGETRPRRPNERGDGEDDPQGRRANRRTEIYLDF